MLLKDITLQTPQENLLYDDVLLHLAEQGVVGEVMRFWESDQYFVVLGRIGQAREDVHSLHVKKDNVGVFRRGSGGGTVLQGKGCLNYSLILSKTHDPALADLRKSYQFILGKVIKALKALGVESHFYPISDIAMAMNEKKFSGNAQKRSKKHILHHGTILYDFDLKKIDRYLKMPKDIPEYRRGRPHDEFVTNVPLALSDIKQSMKTVFHVKEQRKQMENMEKECLVKFKETKNLLVDDV